MKLRTLTKTALRPVQSQLTKLVATKTTSFSSEVTENKDPHFEVGGKMRDILENHSPCPTLSARMNIFANATVGAIKDPTRADLVSHVGETTGAFALSAVYERMVSDPVGRRILEDKPRMRTPFFDWRDLSSMPEGTFGQEYFKFMDSHGYMPEERPVVKYVDDPTLAYVFQRYKEVHDYCHVLLNYDTSVMEELGLKWFEMVQTGVPVSSLSALIAPLATLSPGQWPLFYSTYVPHANKNARYGKFMMNIYYEELMDRPVDEVRKELGYVPM
mmetsp:Transcript_16105/g.18040  ORF Transcript_16105/g.18040 Transcript_16105/m.18040 type:complete len:273 (+) Transcript_16105:77-895(+)